MRRGGALLIELLVALALFVVGGLIILGSLRQGVGNAVRALDADRAADIAASAFAEVAAGLSTAERIDGVVERWQDPAAEGGFEDLPPDPLPWIIEASTDRSTFGDLTLLTVVVRSAGEAGVPDEGGVTHTLRGLVHVARRVEDAGPELDPLQELLGEAP